jgi:hypothetical protein
MKVFSWRHRKAFLILAVLLAVYLLGTCAGRGASTPTTMPVSNTPAVVVPSSAEASARLMAFLGMVGGMQVFGLLLMACPVVLLVGGAAVLFVLRAHRGETGLMP